MSGKRPFTAQFPRKPQLGDEVVVKGKLKADAKVFSINFILDSAPSEQQSLSAPTSPVVGGPLTPCCGRTALQPNSSPQFIAYHFKILFNEAGESVVVQTWKNVVWQQEFRANNDWLKDRKAPFKLIFRFHHDTIRVFVEHTDQPPQFEFEYQVPLERIRIVELWDDVEFVEEVTFRFKNTTKHNGTT